MPTRPYRPDLLKRLKDRGYAAMFLKASFDETLKDGDYESFLLALRDVIEASGSVNEIAEGANITRQHLYLLLKGQGNPTLQTLVGVLRALNITLDFVPVDKSEAA